MVPNLCACGCGGEMANERNKFLYGHSSRGRACSPETRKRIRESNLGWHHSDAAKQRIREARLGRPSGMLGKHHSVEARRRVSEANRRRRYCVGWHHSDETKKKMSDALCGERGPLWQGGRSFEPYSVEWTTALRRSVRERDRDTCQLCGVVWSSGKKFPVHHIDYNKKNCGRENLITLCSRCHREVHAISQDRWMVRCA